MSALGKQGLRVIRQAAQTLNEEIKGDDPFPNVGSSGVWEPPARKSAKSKRKPTPPLPVFDRDALRLKLEAASARPAPGSSELLSRPLQAEVVVGHARHGNKLSMVESHDLTQMAPIHLLREGFKP